MLVWDPPNRVVLSWQINEKGLPEPDPEKASEVDVRFAAEAPSLTRVTLEHRKFERHGEEGGKIWYEAMDSDEGGWTYFLNLYAAALTQEVA